MVDGKKTYTSLKMLLNVAPYLEEDRRCSHRDAFVAAISMRILGHGRKEEYGMACITTLQLAWRILCEGCGRGCELANLRK
jgi:hypothetical protein